MIPNLRVNNELIRKRNNNLLKSEKKSKQETKHKKHRLLDSYWTGFSEGYGDGLANLTNVKKYGYESLNDAVKRIDKAKHVPKVGELNPLVNKLIFPLTLMCEGSRFHPTSDLFQKLIKKKTDEPLSEGERGEEMDYQLLGSGLSFLVY
ncbi:GTP-binding nuclear protein Ran-3 [Tanacetum coccineum]